MLYISAFFAFWLPFLIYTKLFFMIVHRTYTFKDILVQVGYFALVLLIFFVVLNAKQRLYMFSLMTMLIIALSLFLFVKRLLFDK